MIVDSGISEYAPSVLRDYFRGTAAHNTVWMPGTEQAQIWGSFRVAEYPAHHDIRVENPASDAAKITLTYENSQRQYRHQRTVYSVDELFWVIQDSLDFDARVAPMSYSLLHVHPDCAIRVADHCLMIGERLLAVPFGADKIEWSDQSPWRSNLNLYSPGFSLMRPGKLVALTPKNRACFGWVLIPYNEATKPECIQQRDGAEIRSVKQGHRLVWDASELRVAVLAPSS